MKRELSDHGVFTVVEMGWSGVKNGKLLALASAQFDCFLTVDANIQNQQHLPTIPIAILLVRTMSNDPVTMVSLAPEIRATLAATRPRAFATVPA